MSYREHLLIRRSMEKRVLRIFRYSFTALLEHCCDDKVNPKYVVDTSFSLPPFLSNSFVLLAINTEAYTSLAASSFLHIFFAFLSKLSQLSELGSDS